MLFGGGWQIRRGLVVVEMDATRHVVPSVWEPWAVVCEDLLFALNLASDQQVRLPKFAIGVVPSQSTICGGSGLVVGFSLSGCSSNAMPLPVAATEGAWTANAFVQILPDNTVRFYTARAEMGQGVTTGLATLLGEELDVNPLDMDVRLAVFFKMKTPARSKTSERSRQRRKTGFTVRNQ